MALTLTHGKRNRFDFKGAIYHITVRCNNKSRHFKDHTDFDNYIAILEKCKSKHGFMLHNYVAMNNHVHLIIRLESILSISKIMHSINRWVSRQYNTFHNKTGHFWEERFYGELIEDDLQLLTTMIYVDLNPVKAGLCKNPCDWKYSGADHYINGGKNSLIDSPSIYLGFGDSNTIRRNTYKRIISAYCPIES